MNTESAFGIAEVNEGCRGCEEQEEDACRASMKSPKSSSSQYCIDAIVPVEAPVMIPVSVPISVPDPIPVSEGPDAAPVSPPSTLKTSRSAPYLSLAAPPPLDGTMGGTMTTGSTGTEAGPEFGAGGGGGSDTAELWNTSKLKLVVMLGLEALGRGGEASRGATPGVLEKLANSGTAGEEEEKLPKSSVG